MDRKIDHSTKVPFGVRGNKGRPLGQQPLTFVEWMANKLWETDKHEWAVAARKELERRKTRQVEISAEEDLDRAAEDFLRKHDVNPKEFR